MPALRRATARLPLHHRVEIERAVGHDHADEREAHRDLVGDHLRGGARGPHQRELVVRGPAGEHRAQHADPRDREHEQEACIEPGDLHRVAALAEEALQAARGRERVRIDEPARRERAAEGHDGKDQQHGHGGEPGREVVAEAVVGERREVLLEQELAAVRDAVEQAPRDELDARERNPDVAAVGADAVGHDRRLLALHPREDRRQQHHEGDGVEHEGAVTTRSGSRPGACGRRRARAARTRPRRAGRAAACRAPFRTGCACPRSCRRFRCARRSWTAGCARRRAGRARRANDARWITRARPNPS